MADPDALTIGVDALPIGTAALNLVTAGVKFITDLQEEANSPDMVKATLAKKKLADMDALAVAQQKNDIEAERKAAEAPGP